MSRIFGTDGIRDRAGQGLLAPDHVRRVAWAVGTLYAKAPGRFTAKVPAAFRHLVRNGHPREPKVLIGRDTRASGPEIERALIEGFSAAGLAALRAGVVTTPGVAYLTRAWGCALGVVISASHNPAADNGIKFISPQGFKIPDAAERAIEGLLEETVGSSPPRAARPRASNDRSRRVSDYVDFLAGFCRPLKGLKIVVDCGHGAASALAGPLLERLGADAVLLNVAPDGTNINDGCGALHPEEAARAVRREKADLGAAFDGDADRAILVDDRGEVRDGDHVLALCGTHLKSKKALRKDTVVSTVMANLGLEHFLAEQGIALRRTAVGDKFVAEEMLRIGAVLGGEPSGHVLFFDAAPAGDGMLTTLRVLDILAERREPLSRVARRLPKYPQKIVNVPVGRKPPLEEAAGVRRAIEAATRELGGRGRLIVRYSGTEPLCRVMVEGADGRLVERLAGAVADAVKRDLG